jgi:hypothetical protein
VERRGGRLPDGSNWPLRALSCHATADFRRRGLDPDSAQGHGQERLPQPLLGQSGGHNSAGSAAGRLRAGLMDTKIALAGQPLAVCALAHQHRNGPALSPALLASGSAARDLREHQGDHVFQMHLVSSCTVCSPHAALIGRARIVTVDPWIWLDLTLIAASGSAP